MVLIADITNHCETQPDRRKYSILAIRSVQPLLDCEVNGVITTRIACLIQSTPASLPYLRSYLSTISSRCNEFC